MRAFQREGEQLRSENAGMRDLFYVAAPLCAYVAADEAPPAAPFAAWVR